MEGNDYQVPKGAKRYVGTKILMAKLMSRLTYNQFRGWDLPANENGEDVGYIVQYGDGYISWSPAGQFDDAYRRTDAMPFSLAIEVVKRGQRVARKGWNGKGMFIFLVNGSQFIVNRPPLLGIYPEGTEINYQPHIDMRTVDGSIVPWLASQADILSDDWEIID